MHVLKKQKYTLAFVVSSGLFSNGTKARNPSIKTGRLTPKVCPMSDLQQAINKHIHQPETEAVYGYQPVEKTVIEKQAEVFKAPDETKRMGFMKAKILTFALGMLGKKLDGHRTKMAGATFILLGIVGFVGIMYPDQGLPQIGVIEAGAYFATGVGLIGGGGKADKIIAALQANKGE